MTLVVLRVLHHRLEQLLDLMQHHVVELATALAIQSAQEMRNGVGCTLLSGGGPAFCFGFLLTLVFLGFACGVLGAFMLRVGSGHIDNCRGGPSTEARGSLPIGQGEPADLAALRGR